MTDLVNVTRTPSSVEIELNRPTKKNAITSAMYARAPGTRRSYQNSEAMIRLLGTLYVRANSLTGSISLANLARSHASGGPSQDVGTRSG